MKKRFLALFMSLVMMCSLAVPTYADSVDGGSNVSVSSDSGDSNDSGSDSNDSGSDNSGSGSESADSSNESADSSNESSDSSDSNNESADSKEDAADDSEDKKGGIITIIGGAISSTITNVTNAITGVMNSSKDSVYKDMIKADGVEEMYMIMLDYMNNDPDELWELTQDELIDLYQHAYNLNLENPHDDYVDLAETLQYIAGEFDLNGAIVLADVTWSGGTLSKSETRTLSGNVTLNGTIVIPANITLKINMADSMTGNAYINRNFGGATTSTAMFKLSGANSKLIIEGKSDTQRIILDGGNDFDLTPMDPNKNVVIKKAGPAIHVANKDADLDFDFVTIRDMAIHTKLVEPKGTGGAAIDMEYYNPNTANVNAYNANEVTLDYVNIEDCLDRGDSVLLFAGNVTMKNSNVTNCAADNSYAGVIKGSGGTNYCNLLMDNCDATGNYSSGWGGVMLWACGANGSKARLENCDLYKNKAEYLGGALSVEGVLEINNCNIYENTAMSGGGIATFPFTVATGAETNNACGLIVGSGNEIYKNSSTADAPFIPFDAGHDYALAEDKRVTYPAGGGGIWSYMFQPKSTSTVWSCEMSVGAGNKIYGNTAKNIGGGYALMQKAGEGGKCELTINGASIYENVAGNGAGIGVSGGNLIMQSGEVYNHTITGDGAGAYIEGGTFTMNGGTFDRNVTTGNGGAAYVTGGNFTLSGGTIGGSAAADANKAVNGGAVYVTGGTVTMNNGKINGNTATGNGGAIYVNADSGTAFTMTNGEINQNTAANGGALYVAKGNVDIKHGNLNQNTAVKNGENTGNGGAIYMAQPDTGSSATLRFESGNMNNNTAGEDGGAIHATGGTLYIGLEDCKATITKDQKTCTHHTALGADRHHPVMTENNARDAGGGISINDGVVRFYCGSATVNTTNEGGVGKNVFMDGGDFHLYDGANVGLPRNPDLVIVGGNLHNECVEKDYVKLYYYKSNQAKTTDMEGMAEYEEVINMPDGEYYWKADEGYRFLGWTGKGAASGFADENVRHKGQYVGADEPVEILDHTTDQTDKTGVNTNRLFDGTTDSDQKIMHLYALWAPEKSDITIADSLTYGQVKVHEDAYSIQNYDYSISILGSDAAKHPGFAVVGWYLYQDEGKNANWCDENFNPYEPVKKAGSTYSYEWNYIKEDEVQAANPTVGKHYMKYYPLATPNGNLTLQIDAMTFGDITLVADYELVYSDLTITKDGHNAIDPGQTFIFNVKSDSFAAASDDTIVNPDAKDLIDALEKINMTVVTEGDGSVTIKHLPMGKYKVIEDENWSWRYTTTDDDKGENEYTDVDLDGATKTIGNVRDKVQWMDGNAYCLNISGESNGRKTKPDGE